MVIERAIVLVVRRPSWIRRSRVSLVSRHRDRQASSSHRHRLYRQRSIGVLVVDRSLVLVLNRQERNSTWRVQLSNGGIAIDHDRHRIIVTDTLNNRVQVLSLIDGSFLFEFGSKANRACQFTHLHGVCVDNQGRIIVGDRCNRLQAFTHEGHHISSFACGIETPLAVAFDEHRGLIAFSAGNRVHVIGANQWLADTFVWRPALHRYAPSWMKQAVSTMTMIRSLVDERSAMSMIPNELLFEIFSFL